MPKRNWILAISAAGIILAAVFFLFASLVRGAALTDTGETRASINRSLDSILPVSIAAPDDPALLDAASRLTKEEYVAAVWLIDSDGNILFIQGGPARTGDNIVDLSSGESDLVAAVEPILISGPAQAELNLAVAMRREGEHNDVYRHAVRSIPGPGGTPIAYIGIAYDINPSIGAPPDREWILVLGILAASLAVYWLGLPLWVALDARDRGERPILWGAFVLIANLAGVLAYLLVTRKRA
jgi:hypothetical protein